MSLVLGSSLFDRPSRTGKLARRRIVLVPWLLFVAFGAVVAFGIVAASAADDAPSSNAGANPPPAAEAPKPLLLDAASWKRFDAALDSIVTASFDKTPLPDALVALMHQLPAAQRVKLRFDAQYAKELTEQGSKPTEMLVTLQAKDIRLRSALSLALRQFGLDWSLAADRLVVTNHFDRQPLLSRDYMVRDLLSAPLEFRRNLLNDSGDARTSHTNDLTRAICCAVHLPEVAVSGSKRIVRDSSQHVGTWRIMASVNEHEQLGDLLSALRASDPSTRQSPFEQRCAAAMETRISADFVDKPLHEALATLIGMLPAEKRLPLVFDTRALEEASVTADARVSLRAENVRLASALDVLLQPLELSIVGRDDVLLITTRENADNHLVTRIYDLAGLAANRTPNGVHYDYTLAKDMISSLVAPTSWSEVGGPGSLVQSIGAGQLVIDQTPPIHAAIGAMLARWRSPLTAKDLENEDYLIGVGIDAARYRAALSRPITARFENRSLSQIVRELNESAPATSRVLIVLNRKKLAEASVDPDDGSLVTREFEQAPLKKVLDRILPPLELGWLAESDVLMITTKEDADQALTLAAYDVSDIAPPTAVVSPSKPANAVAARPTNTVPRRPNDWRITARPIDQLVEMLKTVVGPTTWDDVGGPGDIKDDGRGVLLVLQTQEGHRQIVKLLRNWRSGASEFPPPFQNTRWAAALEHRVSVDFQDTPLAEALKSLSNSLPANERVTFEFDEKRLAEASVDIHHSLITLKAANVRLSAALRLILAPLELSVVERDGVIFCTTKEDCDQTLTLHVFDVTDLIPTGYDAATSAQAATRMQSLSRTIPNTIAPVSWDEVGGPGDVAPFLGKTTLLGVSQTEDVLGEVRRLLRDLRQTGEKPSTTVPGDRTLSVEDQARYAAALATAVSVDFRAKPLRDALATLETLVPVERRFSIVLDGHVPREMNIDPSTPITLRHFRGTLADALEACLKPLELGVAWRDDVLLVCPADDADMQSMVVRAYDVTRIIKAGGTNGGYKANRAKYNSLITGIMKLAPEETWDDTGGYGSIMPLELNRRWLIVSHSAQVQTKIAKRLAGLDLGK